MTFKRFYTYKLLATSIVAVMLNALIATLLTLILGLDAKTIFAAAIVALVFQLFNAILFVGLFVKSKRRFLELHPASREWDNIDYRSQLAGKAKRDVIHLLSMSFTETGIVVVIFNLGNATAMWVGVGVCVLSSLMGPLFLRELKSSKKRASADSVCEK
jgi:hypothetical protein